MSGGNRKRRSRMSVGLVVLAVAVAAALGQVLPGTAGVGGPQTTTLRWVRAEQAPPRESLRRPAQGRRKTRRQGRLTPSRRAKRLVWRRGPAGPQGPRGLSGPEGAPGPQIAVSLAVNWLGLDNAPGNDAASAELPGVGTLVATCSATTQSLTLFPDGGGGRTVLDVTVFQGEGTAGASSNERHESSGAPVSLPLPPNGMVSGVISVEPVAGDGGQLASPATLLLSSEWKNNDPSPASNYCYVAAQALQQQ